jgi:hypothetical protein
MNLERIIPKESNYIVLKKISDYKGFYLCMDLNQSKQKINNGSIIEAFDFKNVVQFKGLRPFFILQENEIISYIQEKGIEEDYSLELQKCSVVDYAGLNYDVVGFVVNTYAQWNMPTPLLINPNTIANDYKNLFQGKMSNFLISQKINDNFQAGKYDSDILIPLVDANDYKKDLTIIKKRITQVQVELLIAKDYKQKNISLTSKKDVFIDTILDFNEKDIQKIREVNEDLYDKTRLFINAVNGIINDKIETGKIRKEITKLTEEVEKAEESDFSFLNEFDFS